MQTAATVKEEAEEEEEHIFMGEEMWRTMVKQDPLTPLEGEGTAGVEGGVGQADGEAATLLEETVACSADDPLAFSPGGARKECESTVEGKTGRRRPNFTLKEVEALTRGYEKKCMVLNIKVKSSNAKRKAAWAALTKEVNSVSHYGRSVAEVMRKVKDLKAATKSKVMARRKAGCGASSAPRLNEIEERIAAILEKYVTSSTEEVADVRMIPESENATSRACGETTNEEQVADEDPRVNTNGHVDVEAESPKESPLSPSWSPVQVKTEADESLDELWQQKPALLREEVEECENMVARKIGRPRPNFTSEEVAVLTNGYKKNSSILNVKAKGPSILNITRKPTLVALTKELNSVSPYGRSVAEVMIKVKALRKTTRSNVVARKRMMTTTRCGPQEMPPLSRIEERIPVTFEERPTSSSPDVADVSMLPESENATSPTVGETTSEEQVADEDPRVDTNGHVDNEVESPPSPPQLGRGTVQGRAQEEEPQDCHVMQMRKKKLALLREQIEVQKALASAATAQAEALAAMARSLQGIAENQPRILQTLEEIRDGIVYV